MLTVFQKMVYMKVRDASRGQMETFMTETGYIIVDKGGGSWFLSLGLLTMVNGMKIVGKVKGHILGNVVTEIAFIL